MPADGRELSELLTGKSLTETQTLTIDCFWPLSVAASDVLQGFLQQLVNMVQFSKLVLLLNVMKTVLKQIRALCPKKLWSRERHSVMTTDATPSV